MITVCFISKSFEQGGAYMKKQCLIASIAVFIVFFILDFVLHGILLKDIYQQTAAVWRPEAEMQSLMWLMWVGYVIFAPVFVIIYSKGYDPGKAGLGQGIKFGFLIGILISSLSSLTWYAVLPIPAILCIYWFLGGMVQMIVAGAVVGLLHKS